MSIAELLIVALVALLIMKPEDIPVVVAKFYKIKAYFVSLKRQCLLYLTHDLQQQGNNLLAEDIKPLNFYLAKIISIEGHYEGDYSLEEIKARYDDLMAEQRKVGGQGRNRTGV